MKITWFRHNHEDRNDLLRFGLMRLHYSGEIRYVERPFADAGGAGFSKAVMDFPDRRHLSFLLVQNGNQRIKCLVDNEDSFALISPLISEVDVCFCAGYNSDFFEKKQFVRPYSWQDETDIAWYRDTIESKIQDLGSHFSKIKKFVPITTNMGFEIKHPAWKQKIKNMQHRFNRMAGKGEVFADAYKGYEVRDQMLRDLRNHQLEYDIILNDSLWGWPQHRVNLHRQLQDLHKRDYKVRSTLNWVPPSKNDGGTLRNIDKSAFPIVTLPIDEKYELMLAKSRMAVFACGFHWRWRSIMMLALSTGIPVLTDRLLTEAYFDMNEFYLIQQEDHSWESVEAELKKIDHSSWAKFKLLNQSVYDRYMSPESVARYVVANLELN
ncbi:MAG: hypothetical protein EOO10_17455 [Chitinophagaceae bacterium]|nr:MAG: hypothetical protein EOO10_17455 [Chitinophagaceae bacterium]